MNSIRAFLLALPVALVSSASAQTVQLRFKPPVGKTASYTITMSMNMASAAMPGGAMKMTQTTPMTLRVVSRKGNLTTLESKTGQGKVTMPPNSPMAGMKAQIEKAGSGMTTTTTVDEFGNLKGMDAKGGGPSANMARQLGNGMMKGAQGVSFPAKALKVGDTWGTTMDMGKMMGAMGGGPSMTGKFPIVYKLTALTPTTATISVSMKGTSNIKAGASPMTMAMTMAGSMIVDRATGLLKSMTTTTDNNMSMGGMGSMKQHMVMSMKQK